MSSWQHYSVVVCILAVISKDFIGKNILLVISETNKVIILANFYLSFLRGVFDFVITKTKTRLRSLFSRVFVSFRNTRWFAACVLITITLFFTVCSISTIDLFLLHENRAKIDIFLCNLGCKICHTFDTQYFPANLPAWHTFDVK